MTRVGFLVVALVGLGAVAFGDAPSATHFPAARVRAAFARGEPLLETGAYKIHASRRDAPGMGEVHELDTDVIYLLEGSATIVTGGTLVDPRTIGPAEVRGASIAGGRTQRLAGGDVLVVPNGVPHWFSEVQGPLLYYVVKVTAAGGGSR